MKFLSILMIFSLSLVADVITNTTIEDVFHRGTNELTGHISLEINGDDFPLANTASPVYLRFTLGSSAKIGKTIVDLNSSNPLLD